MRLNNIGMNKEDKYTDALRRIAIFLEGLRLGKGNLLPLGTMDLEILWDAITYLNEETCNSTYERGDITD